MALFSTQDLNDGVTAREVWSWSLFDAANSGYTTVILTAVFNAYFVAVVCGNASWATFAWTAVIALSNIAAMVAMPTIALAADLTAKKKLWLGLATFSCISATALLAFSGPGTLVLSAVLVIISNLGYNIGESLNSAFLPELAKEEAVGRVSGWGWALGYVGGLVTLGLCLAVILWGQAHDVSSRVTVAGACLVTAAVFALIAAPLFLFVKERATPQVEHLALKPLARRAFSHIGSALRALPQFPDFAYLVVCGFFYQCGIATVISLAAVYASAVLGFTMEDSVILILAVNVTAAAGAFGFGYVQDFLGHKKTLGLTLLLWVAMVATAYFAHSHVVFWIAANLAGIAMGSSQSAGRAMVSLFAPEQRRSEFYGLWNMALWLSAVIGPLCYGTVTWLTNNDHRLAIVSTGLFFVIGLIALIPINIERGRSLAKQRSAPQ